MHGLYNIIINNNKASDDNDDGNSSYYDMMSMTEMVTVMSLVITVTLPNLHTRLLHV